MRPFVFVVPLAFGAWGCGAEGVSLGREEACVLDAKLVAAQQRSADVPLPACAIIGRNQLVNHGMESPAIASSSDCGGDFCQVAATQVSGWRTTGEAQVIEVWTDGYWGVPSPQGAQFVELDAQTPDTLYQDLVLSPGQPVYWSVLHRGRLGEETIEISMGPPEEPTSQGTLTSSERDWQEHSGIYLVGDEETVTRFSIASRTGTTQGNLIDRAELSPIESGP
jgi:hypothetical protein